MIHSTSAASGRPISSATPVPLARSARNSAGVLRLKPKRCSMRKVAIQSKGSSISAPMAVKALSSASW